MSSGFVSGGTIDEPAERDDEWRRVQHELEEERRRKAELGKQDGGKSLYEVLQQNKMAKQEAFEESIRLKNQFRSLDDDEVEFLDSVLESTRAQEAAVKKETAEQLAEFHRQREEAERALLEGSSTENAGSGGPAKSLGEEEQWAISGKKRKRNKKELLLPPKMRKSSASGEAPASDGSKTATKTELKDEAPRKGLQKKSNTTSSTTITSAVTGKVTQKETDIINSLPEKDESKTAPTLSLGLVAYGSDDDS
ncbi:N-terminal domain of NEFA-interacting nuclear protein NIP30-domain-containing protein, partial [Talaromyces proteolyticus]